MINCDVNNNRLVKHVNAIHQLAEKQSVKTNTDCFVVPPRNDGKLKLSLTEYLCNPLNKIFILLVITPKGFPFEAKKNRPR
jgi:hypothetical protein